MPSEISARFNGIMHRLLPRSAREFLAARGTRAGYPPDFDDKAAELCSFVAPYTMTSPERVVALAEAVRYIVHNRLPGSVAECGVWRGGSMMVVARTLMELGDTSRDLYLYDTYEGMSEPTEADKTLKGDAAAEMMSRTEKEAGRGVWAYSPLDEVKKNVGSTNYPADKIHLVQGKVEETIPGVAPERIALLRLDTDWYESTKHELEHLYDRVVPGGVVIIDDYGHWQGARRAVDEYLAKLEKRPYLHRIDYTGRSFVKP